MVSVGGRPIYDNIPGAEHAITSDDIFYLKKNPGKTLVIGASYIALETAGFLKGLGNDVSVAIRSIPLRGFDQGLANRIVDYMEHEGVKFYSRYIVSAIAKDEQTGKLTAIIKSNYTQDVVKDEFDTIVYAIGRKASTWRLGLDEIGVNLDEKSGKVIVDSEERSSISNIFSIGDCAY